MIYKFCYIGMCVEFTQLSTPTPAKWANQIEFVVKSAYINSRNFLLSQW